MKQQINRGTFIDTFNAIRPDNFTYDGLVALFDYLEEYEEATGTELDLDVIALCCEYSEYSDIEEYLKDYNADVVREEYETEEEYTEAIKEEIKDKTTFIEVDDDAFIIQCY